MTITDGNFICHSNALILNIGLNILLIVWVNFNVFVSCCRKQLAVEMKP